MSILIFDSEGDGLLEQASKCWCISMYNPDWKDTDSPAIYPLEKVWLALEYMKLCTVLVGHNIRGYDLPLFKKVYNWEPKPHQIIVDTLVISRFLQPKRPMPVGMNGNTPHSLKAWGYRLGEHKPEHEDWTQYSEEMGQRCIADCSINYKVLLELEKEMGHKPYWR